MPAAGGRAEALLAICGTFGRRSLGYRQPPAQGATPARRADETMWLSNERCLIGVGRGSAGAGDTLPFVGLVRPRSNPDFPQWQRDMARIALLYEAGRLAWSRPPEMASAGADLDDIMSQLDIACALVDASRTVVYANPAAGRWLHGQRALRIDDGRLAARGIEPQRQLAAAIRGATVGEPRTPRAIVVRPDLHADLPDGGAEGETAAPLVLTCLPLPANDARALLIFGDRARSGAVADILLHAFGLTSCERRLACHLLAGRTIEQAAEEARIQISTARGYLKAIFAKIGVRRQSEFVAVIGALVPPVALPMAPSLPVA